MGVSMTTSVPSRQPRKDAARNRDAILAAAKELFAESADVTMCDIARRAGVGQATLYRNFPDRGALTAVILDERLEHIEGVAADAAGDPDAFFVLLRTLVESTIDLYPLAELDRWDPTVSAQLEQQRQRVTQLMKQPLADAKAAGTLRRDAGVDDVLLVLLMARGAMARAPGPIPRATAANRALTLVLDGLVVAGPHG